MASGASRLKVLLSCYSCGPRRGSEPGVGWNAAVALSELHDVHVLTCREFENEIVAEVAEGRVPEALRFHFFDVPWSRIWWRLTGGFGVRLHYHLWQIAAARRVRDLNARFGFDVAQHLTFVRYWSPSCLSRSGIPYVLGPVGGAEYSPASLAGGYSLRGRLFERLRGLARWCGEHDPLVRGTLRRASAVLATTQLTAERCVRCGVSPTKVRVQGESGLVRAEFESLATVRPAAPPLCFFGLGRLVHLKGYDLAVKALARANLPLARLLLIGGGAEERRLRALAETLGVADRVTITGFLPRAEALAHLAATHVLVHPSHHDSGGWACIEAMAAGKPVICLNWGGAGNAGYHGDWVSHPGGL